MLLEYSGPSLGLLSWAAHIKQFLLFSLLSLILLPMPFSFGYAPVFAFFYFAIKMIFIALVVSFTEIALAKMRLFRVVDFMGFGLVLSFLAFVLYGSGY